MAAGGSRVPEPMVLGVLRRQLPDPCLYTQERESRGEVSQGAWHSWARGTQGHPGAPPLA